MPRAPPKGTPGAAAVAEAASAIFKRIIDGGDGLPTSRLAISARDFVDAPHNEKEDSIMHFFGSGAPPAPPSSFSIANGCASNSPGASAPCNAWPIAQRKGHLIPDDASSFVPSCCGMSPGRRQGGYLLPVRN